MERGASGSQHPEALRRQRRAGNRGSSADLIQAWAVRFKLGKLLSRRVPGKKASALTPPRDLSVVLKSLLLFFASLEPAFLFPRVKENNKQ